MMELISTNLNTNIYIRSEAEFNRAKLAGFWEAVRSLITGRSKKLLCFEEMNENLRSDQTVMLGLQDVSIDKIAGSMGRDREFTRRFAPRGNDHQGKERWRMIYTLAMTGKGFPPVELYKVGQIYYVKDGHHRISVARHLGWPTIQAHVFEIASLAPPDVACNPFSLGCVECVC